MSKPITVELSVQDIDLILLGMTSTVYPLDRQREAFNLVLKLRDKQREAKLG